MNKTHSTTGSLHRHGIRFVAGWLFIVLGILGLFLPILQGFLFLAIGLYLLSPYVPLFRRWKVMLLKRYPGLRHRISAIKYRHKKAKESPRDAQKHPD
jgi:uncharacterized membrane protein YbaN (DUF454 family)